MFFEQIYDKTLAQASYLVGCQAKQEAIVIDPKRDIDTYLTVAAANNLKITHVVETHIHADFLSGARELVAATGAKLYLSDEGGPDWQYEFPHIGIAEGDRINVGNLYFTVMHTPGHTPESISLLLVDQVVSKEPVMLFTGDFVFVGDVGRPDLLEEAAGVVGSSTMGAEQLFHSLNRFKKLPDYVQVWPGHGAGSACGKALGSVPSSTVGYEKIRNWALQFGDDFDAFKAELLSDQPEAPYYFAIMKRLNKEVRPLLVDIPDYPILDLKDVSTDAVLVDTRSKLDFAKGHIKDSLNIQHNNSLANWAGWMLPYDRPLVLIAKQGEKEEITRKLMRIGLDNIAGFIYAIDDEALVKTNTIEANAVEKLKEQEDVVLLDVRSSKEYKEGHIPGAIHYFVGKMAKSLPAIAKDKTIIIQCQSGDRATIASSYLEKNGFENVLNYRGSMLDWLQQGKRVVS